MATTVTQSNPILVTGTINAGDPDLIKAGPLRIKSILWSVVTTAGHILTLVDAYENVVFHLVADAPGTSGNTAYYAFFGDKGLPVEGLYTKQMQSGQILIYFCED